MKAVLLVMILLGHRGNITTNTIEFYNMESCEYFKSQVLAMLESNPAELAITEIHCILKNPPLPHEKPALPDTIN